MAGGHGGTEGRRRGSPCEASEARRGAGRRWLWRRRSPASPKFGWRGRGRDFPETFLGRKERLAGWPGRDDRRPAPLSLPRPLAGSELGVTLASRPWLAVAPGLLVSLSRGAGWVCAQWAAEARLKALWGHHVCLRGIGDVQPIHTIIKVDTVKAMSYSRTVTVTVTVLVLCHSSL